MKSFIFGCLAIKEGNRDEYFQGDIWIRWMSMWDFLVLKIINKILSIKIFKRI